MMAITTKSSISVNAHRVNGPASDWTRAFGLCLLILNKGLVVCGGEPNRSHRLRQSRNFRASRHSIWVQLLLPEPEQIGNCAFRRTGTWISRSSAIEVRIQGNRGSTESVFESIVGLSKAGLPSAAFISVPGDIGDQPRRLQVPPFGGKMEQNWMKANGNGHRRASMKEITLTVERDEESGWLTASWDAPRGQGGISTQGRDLRDLEQNVHKAVRCHFENGKRPSRIRLHFVHDPVLTPA